MDNEEAIKEVEAAKKEEETGFCPMTKGTCRKDCVGYKEPYVKSTYCGRSGTAYAAIKSSCSFKR
jgi:hypothetical protein